MFFQSPALQSLAQCPSIPQLKQRPEPGGGPLPKYSRDPPGPRGPCEKEKQSDHARIKKEGEIEETFVIEKQLRYDSNTIKNSLQELGFQDIICRIGNLLSLIVIYRTNITSTTL